MTAITTPAASALDFTAAARWPTRAAAHVLGLGLVLAVLIALPVAPTDLDRHQLPKETLVHIATWIAVLLARPLPARGFRPAVRWSLAALVALTAASGLVASNGWLALRAGSLILTGAAALLTARHVASLGMSSIVLTWCAAAGIIGAGTGLAQAYGVQSLLFAVTRVPGGTFGNRNFMAHFSALSLPALLLVALTTPRRLPAWTAVLGCAALAAAIVLSRSRAAWLGAGAGGAVFTMTCVAAWRRRALPALRWRPLAVAACLTAGAAAAIVLPNELAWRSSSPYTDTLTGLANTDEGSGHGRLLQYRNTIRLALRHPLLGVGPGNWPLHYTEVAPPSDPTWVFGDVVPINPWPSSDWMALLSEVGIGAVIAALLLGAALFWRGWLAARSGGERVLAGGALLALLTTGMVEGNLDAVLLLPASLLLVAMSTGALLQRADETPFDETAGATGQSRASMFLALALAVVVLRSTLQSVAYIVAGSGRSTMRLTWAARIDPGSYPIRIALAQRLSCAEARSDVIAAVRMAPTWPATVAAAKRCGVRIPR